MPVTVRIPSVMRNLTNGAETVQIQAATVDQLLTNLDAAHPGLRAKLCDDQGKLRKFVNVFVGEEDIRFLDGQATSLKDGETVDIVPAIAGG
jgi:molybdopterin synthase sulfur carrier subunit